MRHDGPVSRVSPGFRLLIGCAIAVTAVAALAVPAGRAAASPGWRIVKTLKYCGNGSMESVVAIGQRDAWGLGEPFTAAARCWADIEHWNGAYWKRVPVPAGKFSLDFLSLSLTPPIAASSAADAWIFPVQFNSKLTSDRPVALHWDGRAWQRFTLPGNPVIESAVALDSHEAWAFGYVENRAGDQVPYAARFGGRAWREATLPGAPVSVSTSGPDDIWAVGPTVRTASSSKQVFIAMQWTGRRWRTLRLPAAKLDVGKDDSVSLAVAATGTGQAWFAYVVKSERDVTLRAGLLEWNGAQWQQFKAPAPIADIDAVSPDGNGGVWLLADAGNLELSQYWYHYADGRWTRQLVLTPRYYNDTMFGMAWVPGTTTVWSVGEADRNSGLGTLGVIARYGA
jgi:hypothetical protein